MQEEWILPRLSSRSLLFTYPLSPFMKREGGRGGKNRIKIREEKSLTATFLAISSLLYKPRGRKRREKRTERKAFASLFLWSLSLIILVFYLQEIRRKRRSLEGGLWGESFCKHFSWSLPFNGSRPLVLFTYTKRKEEEGSRGNIMINDRR